MTAGAAPLVPGSKVGRFEVVEAIGAGAMGEVYRAHDPTLERDVAIKALPAALVADTDRHQRLVREARMLAALSHPHIAQIYQVENVGSGLAIVMELVPGSTLREVIGRRALRPRDIVNYARQIAWALDAAHEKGIVHRDLKPDNIKVAPDGTLKVLDFGLAKTWAGGAMSADSPTDAGLTGALQTVGTLFYMSPEQVRGDAVDRRTDIWAFGCVLFEMCAGESPFRSASSSETIAAILEREPDWQRLPASTSPRLRHLIERCLQKDCRVRLRDIGDVFPDLDAAESPETPARPTVSPGEARWRLSVVAAVLLATLAVAAVGWRSSRTDPAVLSGRTGAIRFEMPPPGGLQYGSNLSSLETTTLAFAPDGSRLAFIAVGGGAPPRVFVRSLDAPEARPVPGTEQASTVFWSPDSRSIGFVAAGKLRRVDRDGGAAVSICDVAVGTGLSASWGASGDILFASVQGEAIYRVPASGGTPVAEVRSSESRLRVVFPSFLPDGRRFLYTWLGREAEGGIILVDSSGQSREVLSGRALAAYVEPGYLLTAREGTLLAYRFDADTGTTIGDGVPILEPVAASAMTGWVELAASPRGMLAVRTHVNDAAITFVRRDGSVEREVGSRGEYLNVRASHDEAHLLFSRWRANLGAFAVWRMTTDRFAETPLTSSPGMETAEVWVPGLREIVLSKGVGIVPNVHLRDLATSSDRQLASSPRFQIANDVSRDRVLVYQQRTEAGTYDLMQVALDDPSSAVPFLATPFSEQGLRFAPDGRRVAFVSDESGRNEVYVAPFPNDGSKTLVSSGGAFAPRWRRDGRELYFLSVRPRQLWAASIDASGQPGPARVVLEVPRWADYDVLDGGKRFVAIVVRTLGTEQPLTVIIDWPQLLAR